MFKYVVLLSFSIHTAAFGGCFGNITNDPTIVKTLLLITLRNTSIFLFINCKKNNLWFWYICCKIPSITKYCETQSKSKTKWETGTLCCITWLCDLSILSLIKAEQWTMRCDHLVSPLLLQSRHAKISIYFPFSKECRALIGNSM